MCEFTMQIIQIYWRHRPTVPVTHNCSQDDICELMVFRRWDIPCMQCSTVSRFFYWNIIHPMAVLIPTSLCAARCAELLLIPMGLHISSNISTMGCDPANLTLNSKCTYALICRYYKASCHIYTNLMHKYYNFKT